MAKKIQLKNVRLSYANLFEARENQSGDLRYSTALIIPKDHPQIDDLHALVDEVGEEKFGKKWASMRKKTDPVHDADEDGKADDDPVYEGTFYINTSSKRKPQVVDRQVQPILDDSEIWSGCYANVSIAVFAFEVPENKGVSFGLNNVQKVKEGERLGGAPNADEEFEAIDDDEDEGFSIE
jgi:hypothetical protein